jgi:hypothetical protein
MDDPIMPEALGKPTPEPAHKFFIHRSSSTQPDGTPVDLEVHHNPVEL